MKKFNQSFGIMLCVLCMATMGCKSHTTYDNDNPVNPSVTSLAGSTWRYDQGQKLTALINFSTQRFTVSVTEFHHDSYEAIGSYSYDGEVLEGTFDDISYEIWCSEKGNGKSLVNTKWISKTTYHNGQSHTGSLEFLSNGHIRNHDFLDLGEGNNENVTFSYDGNTIEFSDPYEGSVSLECGNILYTMSKK